VVEEALLEQALKVNEGIEKHARIGAVIMTKDPWTIENEVLTPTMKIR
jgi:long-chain acyl-CoA synthetase